jgi:copper chaperone CopZ
MNRTFKIDLNRKYCRRCANSIKTELRRITSVKSIEIDFTLSHLEIEYENDNDMRETFMNTLSRIGLFQNNSSCEIN